MQGEGTAQIGPSSSGVVASTVPLGVLVNDILGYIAPTHPGTKPQQLSKKQKYPPKLRLLPEGMKCSIDTIPALIWLKFDDHDLLLLKYVRDKPYEFVTIAPGEPIQRIPKPWSSGLEKFGLLGLINMPHFGQLNGAHACVKQLLA